MTGTPGITVYGDETEGLIQVNVGPTIIHQGRYRLYQKPDGGLHLVYQRDDKDEPDRMELPAQFIRIAQMAGEGKLTLPQLMQELMKLRGTM